MSLNVVVGRPNAGKTGVLFDVVRRAADAGETSVVLLPSRPDVRAVAAEFALHGPRIGVSTRVFDEYLEDLWRLYGDGRSIVHASERRILLARAIRSVTLEILGASVGGGGLARLLSPLAAGIDRDLAACSSTRGVVRDAVAILTAYERTLAESAKVERSRAAAWLAANVRSNWLPEAIVVNRFADMALFQERFLVSAAQHTEVWIALPWEKDLAATRALDPLVSRLVAAGARLTEQAPGRYTESAELQYLESHLFLDPSRALGAPRCGDVRLSHAYGEDAEAERIVAEVQSALDEGVAPDRIAVVFQDPTDHAVALKLSLKAADISAEFDILERARDTGWGRALLHAIRYAMSGARSDLIAFLKTPYSGESRQRADALEADWRRRRVEGGDRLTASLRRESPGTARLIESVAGLIRGGGGPSSPREWKNLADVLLRNASVAGCGIAPGRGKALDADMRLDAAAHRAFVGLVSELCALPGVSTREADTPDDLVEAFETMRIATPGADRSGGVRVMSAARARGQRFDVVIVGGLSEGDFPRIQSENPLAAPETADELALSGVRVERKNERDMARLTFYLVASRAKKRLILSRQVAASDGSELRASWLLEELLDLYRDPAAEEMDRAAMPETVTLTFNGHSESGGAPRTRRRALRAAAASGVLVPDERSAARLAAAARWSGARDPHLADERVLAALHERQVYSASEIETYLRCPYAWFQERVVRARALDADTGPIELGRVCHEALRSIFARVRQELGEPRVTPANLARVLAVAETVLAELMVGEGEPTTVERRALAATARRNVLGFLRAEASFLPEFAPLAHEYEFGPDPTLFDGFQLRGRIDRIDRNPSGGLVVIDYKTGQVGSAHSARKFADSGLVQLALYARVAEAHLGEAISGGLYRRISARNLVSSLNRGFLASEIADSPGIVSTDIMNRDDVDAVLRESERRALEAVEGMREGRIVAEPRDPKTCRWCSVRGLCGGVPQ